LFTFTFASERMTPEVRDQAMMRLALDQAQNAAILGEVPVGAVVIRDGKVLATGFNHPIGMNDPTAHAEVRAIRAAAELLGNYRLVDCELFVTLEPCAMCAGAIQHARLKRLVFGASDLKTGAVGSVLNLFDQPKLNHHTKVQGGVLAEACGATLSDFFAMRRQVQKEQAAREKEEAAEEAAARQPPVSGIEAKFDDE
jgi:tRNA(adenine34) deaminase